MQNCNTFGVSLYSEYDSDEQGCAKYVFVFLKYVCKICREKQQNMYKDM